MPVLLCALAVVAVLSEAAPSVASRSVVLVPAAVPERSERFSADLTQSIRAGLTRGAFELVDAEVAGCAEPGCAAAAARAAKAGHAVLVDIDVTDRDYVLTLSVVTADGELVSQSDARCELCGLSELLTVAEHEAGALRRNLDRLSVGPPVLVVQTRPAGAEIRLDGERIGVAPIERVITTGRHRLRATARGYVPEERDVDAVAGVRERVVLELLPSSSRRDRIARAVGWTAVAVGIAAIGTGAGLIGMHGRPNRIRCSGDDRDADGDCRLVYGTRPAGIGVLVTGVAIEIGGIVLTSVFRRAQAQRRINRR